MSHDELLDRVLAVAIDAALGAGALIKEHSGTLAAAADEKATHQDLVTLVDKACQDLISAAVRDAFPDAPHSFLGEEDVAPGRAASIAATHAALAAAPEWLWICDPIDGTTNFVSGIPLSVVSIGVAFKSDMTVAVIYDPFRDELFTAIKGRGATLNGSPISVCAAASLRAAVVGYGTHSDPRVGRVMLRVAGELVDKVRALRSIGSACLALAYVACGRFAAYLEQVCVPSNSTSCVLLSTLT